MANFLTTRDLTLDNLNVRKRAIVANLVITGSIQDNVNLLPGVSPVGVVITEVEFGKAYPPESPIYSTVANTAAPIKTDGLLKPDALILPPLAATNGCDAFPGVNLPAINARYGPTPAGSLVQAPSACLFVSGNLSSTGTTLTTIAFKGDLNYSSTTYKLKISPGGAWQAPFHTHIVEEQWIITAGSWIFRYFDQSLYDGGGAFLKYLRPGEIPGTNTGPPITFSDGLPSAPNTALTASVGDVVIFKRGSFFEWGSDTSGATVVVTLMGASISNAINTAELIIELFLSGKITLCQLGQYFVIFGSEFNTPFGNCPI